MRARDWWVVPDSAIICGCFKSCMAQPKLRGHPILFAHAGLFSGKGVAPFLSNPRYAEAVVSSPCLALPCARLTPPLPSALCYPGLFLSITMLRCSEGDPKETTLDPPSGSCSPRSSLLLARNWGEERRELKESVLLLQSELPILRKAPPTSKADPAPRTLLSPLGSRSPAQSPCAPALAI